MSLYYSTEIQRICKLLQIPINDSCSITKMPSAYIKTKLPGTVSDINKKTNLGINLESFNKFIRYYKKHSVTSFTNTDLEILFCHYYMYVKPEGFIMDDYFAYELYNKDKSERDTFISEQYKYYMRRIFNRRITLLDKDYYNKMLKGTIIHRNWVYARRCTFDEFKKFYNTHTNVFMKPCKKSFGIGAKKVDLKKYSCSQIYSLCKRNDLILEELIEQCDELAALNKTSINTIRVHTVIDKNNDVHIVSCTGRIGIAGGIIDNFKGGGFGVKIDPKTGKVLSDGVNNRGQHLAVHPDSSIIFKEFTYPNWDKVVAGVTQGSKIMSKIVKHIGWDVAITKSGEIEIIEMNSMPGCNIPQMTVMEGLKNNYAPYINMYTGKNGLKPVSLKKNKKTNKKPLERKDYNDFYNELSNK